MTTNWPDERLARELAARNPQPGESLVGAEQTAEAADLLRAVIGAVTTIEASAVGAAVAAERVVEGGSGSGARPGGDRRAHRPGHRLGSGRRRRAVLVGVAAAVVLVAVVVPLANGGGGLTGPTRTPRRAAVPFRPPGTPQVMRSGSWQLLGALLRGTWTQNVDGPPPGTLTCASAAVCYVMAGRYRSPDVNAPLLSESLYVTYDLGASWDVVPMPAGFAPTTALSCWDAAGCAAGGTLHGQPILASTTDGGHRWTLLPLSTVPGVLLHLVCVAARRCAAISGPPWTQQPVGAPDVAPGESYATTGDGGRTWHTHPLAPADAVTGFACSGAAHCLVVGRVWAPSATPATEVDFVRSTADGGRRWVSGTLPQGFVLGPISGLSCASAAHCFVTGMIPIPNAWRCGPTPGSVAPARGVALPPMSPAVAALSRAEAALAVHAAAAEVRTGTFGCSSPALDQVSDVASTSDGGRTWTPDPLPAHVPRPQLGSITCATATQCWVAGSEAVPEHVGTARNMSSPVLLGTIDGGATWSKVAFAVPAGAPDAYGQSYLAIGNIDCPAANACVALGGAAQSAPTAPVYRLVAVPDP